MKKIKILHIVEDLKIGGLEKVIASITAGLNSAKYQCSVWCISRGGAIADQLVEKGIDVEILDIHSYYDPFKIFKLVRLLKGFRPDILHTHTYFSNTIGRLAGKLAKVPVMITHVHSTYFHYSQRNLFIERFLSRYTDKIVCCSNAVKDFVVNQEKISEAKAITIYNGVKKASRSFNVEDSRRLLNVEENDIVVTTIGSLFPHKGHRYLIDAFAKVRCNEKNIKCLIVGDGPLRKELEHQAKVLGLEDKVRFLGIQKNIAEVLSVTDIFVLPSCEQEGLGIAMIEAMAYGNPVIGTNIGGIPEVIVDGVTGLLFSAKDAEQLAKKLSELIDDADKRIKYGHAAQKHYKENFTEEMMLSKIENLYEKCIRGEII